MPRDQISPWIFYPAWIAGLIGYLALWTYGELGTFHGTPNAGFAWALSIPAAIALVVLLFKRIG
jgi:hypothetical protein